MWNYNDQYLCHYGVKGMKWGVRRSQKQLQKYYKKKVSEEEAIQFQKDKRELKRADNQSYNEWWEADKKAQGTEEYWNWSPKTRDRYLYKQTTYAKLRDSHAAEKGKKYVNALEQSLKDDERDFFYAELGVVAGGGAAIVGAMYVKDFLTK